MMASFSCTHASAYKTILSIQVQKKMHSFEWMKAKNIKYCAVFTTIWLKNQPKQKHQCCARDFAKLKFVVLFCASVFLIPMRTRKNANCSNGKIFMMMKWMQRVWIVWCDGDGNALTLTFCACGTRKWEDAIKNYYDGKLLHRMNK